MSENSNVTLTGRPRNATTLPVAVLAVLAAASGPMTPTEVEEAVTASGYQSTSKTFNIIINGALGSLRKAHQVGLHQGKRAQYQINKKGRSVLAKALAPAA